MQMVFTVYLLLAKRTIHYGLVLPNFAINPATCVEY
jgi:hypothetical protein